jgi:hypothetical protein
MAGLESLSLPTSVSRVPDIGQGPCQEGAACPAGVGGLRYLPAVQRPFPDTFIGMNYAGETGGFAACRSPVQVPIGYLRKLPMTTTVSLRAGYDVGYFNVGQGAAGCAGAMAYYQHSALTRRVTISVLGVPSIRPPAGQS